MRERERERESMCVCLPIGARKKIFCKTEIVRAGIGREWERESLCLAEGENVWFRMGKAFPVVRDCIRTRLKTNVIAPLSERERERERGRKIQRSVQITQAPTPVENQWTLRNKNLNNVKHFAGHHSNLFSNLERPSLQITNIENNYFWHRLESKSFFVDFIQNQILEQFLSRWTNYCSVYNNKDHPELIAFEELAPISAVHVCQASNARINTFGDVSYLT